MVLMVLWMDVWGENQSVPKDILTNMIYSRIIFQENETVCQVAKYVQFKYTYIQTYVIVSSMFQNYNLLLSCLSFTLACAFEPTTWYIDFVGRLPNTDFRELMAHDLMGRIKKTRVSCLKFKL